MASRTDTIAARPKSCSPIHSPGACRAGLLGAWPVRQRLVFADPASSAAAAGSPAPRWRREEPAAMSTRPRRAHAARASASRGRRRRLRQRRPGGVYARPQASARMSMGWRPASSPSPPAPATPMARRGSTPSTHRTPAWAGPARARARDVVSVSRRRCSSSAASSAPSSSRPRAQANTAMAAMTGFFGRRRRHRGRRLSRPSAGCKDCRQGRWREGSGKRRARCVLSAPASSPIISPAAPTSSCEPSRQGDAIYIEEDDADRERLGLHRRRASPRAARGGAGRISASHRSARIEDQVPLSSAPARPPGRSTGDRLGLVSSSPRDRSVSP